MTKVTIYTDGGVRGNGSAEAIGAYGVVLICGRHKKEIKEAFKCVTNNQMELKGAIEALKLLKFPCEVDLYTDSNYVVRGMNEWIHGWIRKNWIASNKKPVANKELWQELEELRNKHKVNFIWVRGHNGNEGNERADQLCNIAMNDYWR